MATIKDEAYVISLDDYRSIVSHWMTFCESGDNGTCFNFFGVEYIPKISWHIFIEYKNMIQLWFEAYYFILNNKMLTDFTNIFSQNSFEKNNEITLEHFQ